MSPADVPIHTLVDALLAIGMGLFIGLEREHSDVAAHPVVAGEQPSKGEVLLGVRTFALLALFGWVSAYAGSAHPWVPVAGLVAAGALVTVAAIRERQTGRGLTTEVAALTTFVLGMVVHQQRMVAVALALATTLLLISKPWFRALVPRMRRVDFTATLQLLVLLAIVLPLLPDEARDPWHVLSPRRIGLFVALIAGIGYVGYVLHRLLGAERGAGLMGLVGGLVSSTAVTVAMAQDARRKQAMVGPGQLATLLSSAVMPARVLVVAALVNINVTRALSAPLGAMIVLTTVGALWKWRQLRRSDGHTPVTQELDLPNPFSLVPALKWGMLLAAVLVGSAVARTAFGSSGFVATAAISGLVDVDAITLAATRSVSNGELDVSVAALAVTVAITSNTIVKGAIAWFGGGRRFGADIAKVFGAAIAGGVVVAALNVNGW
jgi:uncharacterized membrane protein (DUF4010 family)